MEVPTYSTQPNLTRVLLPRIFSLLILSALLYFGVRVNFIVFNKEFPSMINYIVIAIILILIIADIFLTGSKNKNNKIYFFNDRIEIRGKEQSTIPLAAITNADVKKNVFDILLKTGDVFLSTGQTLKNLSYPERIKQYILQLVRRPPQLKV
jgi:hypothetical protein